LSAACGGQNHRVVKTRGLDAGSADRLADDQGRADDDDDVVAEARKSLFRRNDPAATEVSGAPTATRS
jgi:hypothetical protein